MREKNLEKIAFFKLKRKNFLKNLHKKNRTFKKANDPPVQKIQLALWYKLISSYTFKQI